MLGTLVGGLLAILGGVTGQLLIYLLKRKRDITNEKKQVYINVINILYKMKIDNLASNFDMFDLIAKIQLFASDEVVDEFEKTKNYYLDYKNNIICEKEFLDNIDAFINVIIAIMRRELKTETVNSKKLYSLTVGKRKENHNAD